MCKVLALWKGNLAAEFLWGGYMGTQFLAYRSLQVSRERLYSRACEVVESECYSSSYFHAWRREKQ